MTLSTERIEIGSPRYDTSSNFRQAISYSICLASWVLARGQIFFNPSLHQSLGASHSLFEVLVKAFHGFNLVHHRFNSSQSSPMGRLTFPPCSFLCRLLLLQQGQILLLFSPYKTTQPKQATREPFCGGLVGGLVRGFSWSLEYLTYFFD